jgi:outer membrane protein OmpA-like peptidoglycan-associated protein
MRTPWLITILVLITLSGCAGEKTLRAVLLPDQEGRVGVITVKSAQGEALLDQPYQAADVFAGSQTETTILDPAVVQKQFGQALSAQPPRPVSFTVYFIEGRDELTPDSKPMMDKIKAELARRPFPQINVIGHTDRVGSIADNDKLSLKRAEAVRRILIQAGIAAALIEASGRGPRELLVPTDDGVAEPRNRRVEISVR